MSDGAVIAEAEGFVGEDEPTWFGGTVTSYGKTKVLPKRPDYAIRAMAQTRAISRACRSAFAHVVVMMNAGLSTTPAEEVPSGGFDDDAPAMRNVTPEPQKAETRGDQSAGPDLNAEMDACQTKRALLAWEQFRLKEIARLTRDEGAPLEAKFKALLKKLPEDAPLATEEFGLDVPEFEHA